LQVVCCRAQLCRQVPADTSVGSLVWLKHAMALSTCELILLLGNDILIY
jgi:hypothetical protein